MEKPQMCFLQETKRNSTTLGRILSRAWPECRSVAVDASGASGGLAIAWNSQEIALSDFHASHHLIQATFHILGTNFMGIYPTSIFRRTLEVKKRSSTP